MTVLIVEDHQPLRRAIKSLIGDLAAVYECDGGSQALAAYRQHRPDWVLVDLRLGGPGGIAVTRQVKAAFPLARIIVLADFDDESLRAEAEGAGASAYLLKENLLAIRALITQEA